jgi:hypothetical protein
MVNTLTALGFAIPAVVYFWVVAHYGVNVLVNDQLTDVSSISASKTQLLPWGVLWAQHTDNRMLFPHLIDIALANTVHFNIKFEEFLSATMLVAASALLIVAHKRRSPRTPWLYYCPVAVLALSLVQYENTLWGFEMAWYLVLLAFSVAIFLLDRITLSTWALVGAIAAGVVGSYSLLQGLFIWPVGLILLYHRRRGWPAFVTWMGCGSVTVALFLINFRPIASSGNGYALDHPVASVKFFLFALGDILGVALKLGPGGNTNVLLFGVVVLTLAVFAIACYGLRRDEHGAGPIGVVLIAFGLLFAASVTQGRIRFGYWGAGASRYTTFDLLVVIGIYLCVLGTPNILPARQRVANAQERSESSFDGASDAAEGRRELVLRAIRWLVAVVIFLQFMVGLTGSVQNIQGTNRSQLTAARVSHRLNQSSDKELSLFVAPWLSPSEIRHDLRTAENLHLSLYYGPSG